ERRAARWYRLRGWRILGANVWAGGNEVDLVARRGRSLRFVEVKEKRGSRFGDPAEMVSPEKQRRVRRAAETWLASRPELDGLDVAFDVIAVHQGKLRRIADAF
ncbi:MAG TPA: YraN family protein, partial [Gaiellaceae bacterium]|nr:YraN family protein [Gaiellaceae bacterium]